MLVVCCALLVAHCLLYVLFVGSCCLFAIWSLLMFCCFKCLLIIGVRVLCCLLCVVCCLLFVVCCLLFVVCSLLVVGCVFRLIVVFIIVVVGFVVFFVVYDVLLVVCYLSFDMLVFSVWCCLCGVCCFERVVRFWLSFCLLIVRCSLFILCYGFPLVVVRLFVVCCYWMVV